MICSPTEVASKNLFVVIEKQILRDLAEGILLELTNIADSPNLFSSSEKKSLQYILKYAATLAKLSE